MSKRDADTNVRRIAREIVKFAGSHSTESMLLAGDPDLESMLHKVQSVAISLSVGISELISLMKRQDPESVATTVDVTESPQDDAVESKDEKD